MAIVSGCCLLLISALQVTVWTDWLLGVQVGLDEPGLGELVTVINLNTTPVSLLPVMS